MRPSLSRNITKLRNITSLNHAIEIFLGTLLLWVGLRGIGDRNPVWAIISFIVVSDPDVRIAWPSFISRFMNTLVGCVTGVLALLIFGPVEWILPPTLALTVLVCTNLIKTPGSWKIAPMTTALVLTAALVQKSSAVGFEQSLRRAEEVLLGSLLALILSWVFSKMRNPSTGSNGSSGK
ncbi:FUSC family protein [Leptolyngbya sp. NK1-12]|uniref:FUSC family protein n=1 Tax=Leptolyngbya sp. NK1-12 TaxID=2547451 RepID=A0AA96WKI3_9CYAN|nr:FUSC family protein [Leptolyngbya sp. NK1-12]